MFIVGYFKAPLSLLLPFKDHQSGHYVTYDLRRFKKWEGIFLQVVMDQKNEEKLQLPAGYIQTSINRFLD